MAVESAKSRVTVIFDKDNSFSPHITCYLLYGQEITDSNGDKILDIDDAFPYENDVEQTPVKHEITNFPHVKLLLGLLCNKEDVDQEKLFNMLKQENQSRAVLFLVVSIDEILKGKSLVVLRRHSAKQTPFLCRRNIEIRIICLEWNVSRSVLSWLYPVDLNNEKRGKQHLNLIRKNQMYNAQKQRSENNRCSNANSSVFNLPSLVFLSVFWLLGNLQASLPAILKQLLGHLTQYLFVAKQLSYRFSQLFDLFVDRKENSEQVNTGLKSISKTNLLLLLLIDIIIGLLVVNFIFSNQRYLLISSWLIGQKYKVAEQLLHLLNWLMGAPAGLKLNIPLNQFLGNFYIYHVYLWTNYLYFIEAYLPTIILSCTLAGCLGVTFLLALLCDLVSLLTAHIHCFYIYAARLFGLEIHVLSSLLRLFTGKKWSFLRKRVDSVEYDVDRLFIGTLLFTILLFLFPTVLLYYIVFTSLILLVLLVQSFLNSLVALLNSFPVFGLWLYFVAPEKLPGRIIVDTQVITNSLEHVFSIEKVNVMRPECCLYLQFKHECLPWGNLFTNCMNVMFETSFGAIFGEGIFYKLLIGQIISKS